MKCFWIFGHNYTKWEEVRSGVTLSTLHGGIIGYWCTQSRTCNKCGKLQIKTIRTN